MQAGKLDRLLTILRHSAAGQDDSGAPVETWTPADPPEVVDASRTDVSDGEKAVAGATLGTLRTRFVVRSSSVTRSVGVKDRVSEDGQVFALVGIKQIGRDEGLEWTADARRDA